MSSRILTYYYRIHPMKMLFLLMAFFALFYSHQANAQKTGVQWLTFEQLEDSLSIAPKKVFISFYADWCAYCKKMDAAAFKDTKVVTKLNAEFYAVKMNAETTAKINFGEATFMNKEVGKKRNPTHEIARLLASRKGKPFTLPAMVVLNEQFEVTDRYFTYLSPKALYNALNK